MVEAAQHTEMGKPLNEGIRSELEQLLQLEDKSGYYDRAVDAKYAGAIAILRTGATHGTLLTKDYVKTMKTSLAGLHRFEKDNLGAESLQRMMILLNQGNPLSN